MSQPNATTPQRQAAERKRAAVRTAWIVGAIALAIYLAFLCFGMRP